MGVGGRESVLQAGMGTRKGRKRGIRSRMWFWLDGEGRGVCVCGQWWVVSGWSVGLWCCAGAGEDLQHCRTAVRSRRKMEISVHRLQHVLTVVAP